MPGTLDGAGVSLQVDSKRTVLGNREIYHLKGTRLPLIDVISSLSALLWICVRDIGGPHYFSPLPTASCPPEI